MKPKSPSLMPRSLRGGGGRAPAIGAGGGVRAGTRNKSGAQTHDGMRGSSEGSRRRFKAQASNARGKEGGRRTWR
jgi:hypothetical protein